MTISPQLVQEAFDAADDVYSGNISVVPGGGGDDYQLLPSSALDSFDIQHEVDGFFARAYVNLAQDNIIIAYEGSFPSLSALLPSQSFAHESTAADLQLLGGEAPNALDDAVAFAKLVHKAADDDGLNTAPIYVTGHSLGGTEAEEAALHLNTMDGGFISGGVTFAATGLPRYLSPGGNGNFVNFVDTGDPVGNYADDSVSELRSISKTGSHFGTVEEVGTASGAEDMALALSIAKVNPIEGAGAFVTLVEENHSLVPPASADETNYYEDLRAIYPNLRLDPPVSISTGTTVVGQTPSTTDPNIGFLLAGESASTTSQQSNSPAPIVDNPSSASVGTNSLTPLSTWFSAAEANSGGDHSVVAYNLFVVDGSGSLIVDGEPYSQGNIAENISPAEFATAYFNSGANPGQSEIAVIAIDDLGNYSIAGDMTVSVSAPSTPPQPVVPTDNTPPTIATDQQLVVGAGQEKTLTPAYLQATDSNSADFAPSQLKYVVASAATNGYLVNNTGSIVASFTQQDIDNGLIKYVQSGLPASNDQFTYRVIDPAGNASAAATFNIEIQPPPTETAPTLTTDTAVSVGEGLSTLITDDNLNVTDSGVNPWQIIYTITGAPSGGEILADGINPVTYFTQQQVDLGLISYKNNGSASGPDNFTFAVADGMGGSIGQTTFDVNVIPHNNLTVTVERPISSYQGPDNFLTGTNAPPTYGVVGPDVLSAVDAGVDPQEITYTVNSVPTNALGFRVGTWNGSGQFTGTALTAPATTFTQSEVDAGEVFYASPPGANDNTSENLESIVLSASDNAGNSVSNIVLPVMLFPGETAPIGLLSDGQFTPAPVLVAATLALKMPVGQSTALGPGLITYISPWYSSAQIEYALEYAPHDGTLYLNGQPLKVNYPFNAESTQIFTQQDIDEGHLTYVENGPSLTPDEFGLYVADPYYGLNNPFAFTVSVTTTGTDGGQVLTGSAGAEMLSPGTGNNYLVGDGNTTANYTNSPNGILANLITGSVSNGYGGTDILSNIRSIIGSAYNDTFIAAGLDTFTGGGGEDTFEGTAANLNGGTITDLSGGDKIVITDANSQNFSFHQDGSVLSFDPDTSISQTFDTLALSNDPLGHFLVSTDSESGVDLTFIPTLSVASFLAAAPNVTGGTFFVADTAAKVQANLAALEADVAHIDSITATGGQVTVANYLFVPDEAALNEVVGGVNVIGLAGSLQNNLAALEADVGHINSITATGGTLTTYVSLFQADEAVLNKVVGGFTLTGVAATVQANLAALEADVAHIDSITATGGQVTVANYLFVPDEAALNEVVGGVNVIGLAGSLQNNLAALEADVGHINSITATGGTLTTYVSLFQADEAVLNKVVGGFTLTGVAATVQANLAALEADVAHINSIAFSNSAPPLLNLTATQASADAGILGKVTSPYILDVSNPGAPTVIVGHGNNLTIKAVAGTSTITGGGANENFVFSHGFGQATITDFAAHDVSPSNDTISLSSLDFGTWATLLSDAHSSGVGGTDTTFASKTSSATLTITAVPLSAFQQSGSPLQGDFKFV